ncbi:MAG: AAA family ATPase [Alphaproteobacteria bacterium]|nr:AAA family ATPase [Alphaproteobacteria bacterium]MDE1984896.1 AAA family ATPase [Alphaproteobacteria bacterium]MDE2163615.1 AAA family ATPase [Alphaproteobacteria bacterium]MDE2499385.1 AAA family ATPase [Alphaproteobacteria bacterium]
MTLKSMGPRLTAIGSGKGGTGKTFLTLSLAQTFADLGERVLLCDADLGLSNTAVQLGLAHGGDLPALLSGTLGLLKDAVVRVETPPHAGFDLLAAPAGVGSLVDADTATAENLAALLKRAIAYDRVLIDLGAGVGAAVMTLAAHADDTLVLATPDPASLTDAYVFVKLMLKRTGGRPPAVVVNMASGAHDAKRTADALMRSAHVFLNASPAYLGFVPNDPRVVEAIRHQVMLCTLYPQSPAVAAIAALASALGVQLGRPQVAQSLR